jgi:hypothetical protein
MVYLTALSKAQTIAFNDRMINERLIETLWKKAMAAYFKAVSQNLPGGTDKNYENLSQDILSPG